MFVKIIIQFFQICLVYSINVMKNKQIKIILHITFKYIKSK